LRCRRKDWQFAIEVGFLRLRCRVACKPAILIVVENLPVPLDRRVWQESCALRDAGYEVVVICPQMRGYLEPEEVIDGIHIYRHWISEEARGIAGFFSEYASAVMGELRLAWKVWRRHRFEVIHLCNPPDLLWIVALPFKLFMGVKVIYDVHDVWPEMFEAKFGRRGMLYWAVRVFERCTYLCADIALATNESVKRVAMSRGGMKDEDVYVVRTSPKIVAGDAVADAELRQGRKYLVGYVGVMGNADGVDLVLEAIAHIVHELKRSDIQFVLMGTGPEFEVLQRRRVDLKLEGIVEMPGRVSDEFLFSVLKTMDLGVSGDPRNGYNDHCTMNKVLEYMAFGKAQVMFDLAEGRASAGDASLYVGGNDPLLLGSAIVELLDDPTRRKRMGVCGRERLAEKLSWDRSVEQLLKSYRAARNA
jgi:glycosyltransferase involved in cell wall biosynthesis